MADQAFEFSAKLEFRPMKDDDVQDLQTYCFSNKTIDEIKEEISQDLDRIEKVKCFELLQMLEATQLDKYELSVQLRNLLLLTLAVCMSQHHSVPLEFQQN